MRLVATAILVLALPLVPTPLVQANDFDECNDLRANKPCHEFELPAAPPGHGKKYYLYAASLRCPVDKPNDAACVGRQNPQSELPGGGGFGLLYEETNTFPGLQRFEITLPDGITKYPADKMILY
jgi:hypothetical protein